MKAGGVWGCADVESGWEQRGWTEGYGRHQSNCGEQGGLRLAGPISKNLQLRMGGSSGGEQRLLWTGARCAGYRECGLGLVRCSAGVSPRVTGLPSREGMSCTGAPAGGQAAAGALVVSGWLQVGGMCHSRLLHQNVARCASALAMRFWRVSSRLASSLLQGKRHTRGEAQQPAAGREGHKGTQTSVVSSGEQLVQAALPWLTAPP